MENSLIVTALSLSLLFFVWLKHYSSRSSLPVPPGPKGLPLLGNVFDIPSSMPWKAFRDLSITYGDVLYLKVPTQKILVLNSAQATLDLLEKRSDIYSSRIPRLMNDIVFPTPWAFVLMEYSKLWRTHRREFHHHFHKEVVHNYRPIQLRQCRSFLQRVLDDSGRLGQHIRLIYSAIILKIVYDMDVNDMDHKYVQIVEEVVTTLSVAQVPGKFWVEFVPILRHIPSWVPGAYFKRWAEQVRPVVNQMINLPFDDVKRNMAAGKAGPSVAAAIIESMQADEKATAMWKEREEIARGVTAVTYAAATDTTTGAAQTFFMAMSLFPHVQRKAQEELDRVVGPSRLPEFDDFDNLVYIQAVILESLRWMPVLPMGIPHALIRDDEYRGYFIPKGTMVIANIWAMLRDPEDYPDPENFNPDRFIKDGRINPDVRDPGTIAFGFGRRVCPGKWLSSGSLFMTIASVLHTLDIHPILEPDGKKYDPFNHRIDGINLTVKDVPCTVTPRSESAERLIRQWASLS